MMNKKRVKQSKQISLQSDPNFNYDKPDTESVDDRTDDDAHVSYLDDINVEELLNYYLTN